MRVITRNCSLALVLIQASMVQAQTGLEGVRIVAGLSVGYTTYSFNEKLDQRLTFPTTNIVVAAAAKRWQLSLNGGFTLDKADVSEEEDVGDASREDIDITLGYQINRHWSVFGGYKSGETRINFTSREAGETGERTSQRERYRQRGPYLGTSYTVAFEKAGSLNFSVAYADLRATNEFSANTDEPEIDEQLEFDDIEGRVSGDTTGFSYALTWTMPVSGNLLFQTRIKINDYKQDVRFGGNSFNNVDESLQSLHIGLSRVF